MTEPLMTSAQFETMRLYLVALTVLYRLVIMPSYLQAYLNLAYDKVDIIIAIPCLIIILDTRAETGSW